jgi:CBS domain-containing protein
MASTPREEPLANIHARLVAREPIEAVSVRTFLGWFGQKRRGYWVNQRITGALKAAHLITVPDFNEVHSSTPIGFALADMPEHSPIAPASDLGTLSGYAPAIETIEPTSHQLITGGVPDPAFRIRRLESANSKPLSVSPNCSLSEVVTLMLRHDFSQLPVMTSERDVKGIVSWSSIGARLALGRTVITAQDCMEPHYEVPGHTSLFSVVSLIVENSYVLVRAEDRTISGIVTTSDLSLQFQQLSEPFLLLSEIENHIRTLVTGRFTTAELNAAKDSAADPARDVETVADLTFGEYIRLLENKENWTKIALNVDRAIFVRELDKVRRVRNDVVHIDPEGIDAEDHKLLRKFLQFLHQVLSLTRAPS